MEKQAQAQPDSLATVAVKDYSPSEYAPSELREPPPAYQKPRSSAVQIAKIAAVTIILSSFVLGSFILAAAWIEARSSCMPMEPAETSTAGDAQDKPRFEHLVDPLQQEESQATEKQELPQQNQFQIKLPLQLDFDELAGMLVEKNQRARMNCVVEKRKAEEVVDHQPKTVRLPFGLNLTTDPRYEHLSGEKMAIFCESGKDQRHAPMEMMSTPLVIPLPGPVHLPLPFQAPMPLHVKSPHHVPQAAVPIPVHAPLPVPLPMHVAGPPVRPMPPHGHVPLHLPVHPSPVHAEARAFPLPAEGRAFPLPEGRVFPLPEGRAFQIPEGRAFQPQPEGRAFSRVPVHIPLQMRVQEPRRPHYVQPRSIPEPFDVHHRDKRVRRCACDCSC